MKYLTINANSLPGVEVRNGAAYAEVGERWWPVKALIADEKRGFIPLLDIPQMSDETWMELTDKYPAREPVYAEAD